MTYNEIHRQILRLLEKKMKIRYRNNSYTARFACDFHMTPWEINLLLAYVEEHFHVRLKPGLECQLLSMNQLVALIRQELQTKTTENKRISTNLPVQHFSYFPAAC